MVFVGSDKQKRVWVGKGKEKQTAPLGNMTYRNTMLIASFTCSSKRILVKLLPQGDTVDSKVMIDYLKDTRKIFVIYAEISDRNLFLIWDNAKPHTSKESKNF